MFFVAFALLISLAAESLGLVCLNGEISDSGLLVSCLGLSAIVGILVLIGTSALVLALLLGLIGISAALAAVLSSVVSVALF